MTQSESVIWQHLPGTSGSTLAVEGDVTAASTLSELSVWRTDLVRRVTADVASPGRPRIVRGEGVRVWWGPHALDTDSGVTVVLDDLRGQRRRHSSVPGFGAQGGVTNYAWSPDGALVLVSTQHGSGSQSLDASAVLMSPDGSTVASLWRNSDLAPVAGWVGTRFAVVGARRPVVFDLKGRRIVELPGAVGPVRIETSSDERALLVVAHDQLALCETDTWTTTTAAGPWLDAAVAPDGDQIAAIRLGGELTLLDPRLRPRCTVSTPGPPTGVALGADRIVVAVGSDVHTAHHRP